MRVGGVTAAVRTWPGARALTDADGPSDRASSFISMVIAALVPL
jgi:hypothetical protein